MSDKKIRILIIGAELGRESVYLANQLASRGIEPIIVVTDPKQEHLFGKKPKSSAEDIVKIIKPPELEPLSEISFTEKKKPIDAIGKKQFKGRNKY